MVTLAPLAAGSSRLDRYGLNEPWAYFVQRPNPDGVGKQNGWEKFLGQHLTHFIWFDSAKPSCMRLSTRSHAMEQTKSAYATLNGQGPSWWKSVPTLSCNDTTHTHAKLVIKYYLKQSIRRGYNIYKWSLNKTDISLSVWTISAYHPRHSQSKWHPNYVDIGLASCAFPQVWIICCKMVHNSARQTC